MNTEQFERAGLKVRIVDEPLVPTIAPILQMDIANRNTSDEEFWFYIPEGCRVQVTNVDPDERQLILFAEEPQREFTTIEHTYEGGGIDEHLEALSKGEAKEENIISVKLDGRMGNWRKWKVIRSTPGGKRHFLMGHDERAYFIAQLPRPATTVQQAHDILKPQDVPEGALRQGEWFFIPATPEEKEMLETVATDHDGIITTPVGRPTSVTYQSARNHSRDGEHVADLVKKVRIDGVSLLFVKGKVRQLPRHATLELLDWHRVVRNLENETTRFPGLRWVD